jgi:hypothetical protein
MKDNTQSELEIKPDVIVKYSSYTEAQKRATQKYRVENKEKVNEQRKIYYQKMKEKNPNFLEYKREKAKMYYLKKKTAKTDSEPKTDSEILLVEVPKVKRVVKSKRVKIVEPETVSSSPTPPPTPVLLPQSEPPKVKKSRSYKFKGKSKDNVKEPEKEILTTPKELQKYVLDDDNKEVPETIGGNISTPNKPVLVREEFLKPVNKKTKNSKKSNSVKSLVDIFEKSSMIQT